MNFFEKRQKLDYLLEMIEKGRCISVQQIAKQFDCSDRSVKRMVALLKLAGNEIYYCKKNKKYCIKKE